MQLESGEKIERLRDGESFGWDGWLLNLPRSHTIRALTHVDLYYLNRFDLDRCLQFFPELKG